MAKNIARLIEDNDGLDINRQNMMEELKVLRDVTLFYNEQHPELRAAYDRMVPTSARQQRPGASWHPAQRESLPC